MPAQFPHDSAATLRQFFAAITLASITCIAGCDQSDPDQQKSESTRTIVRDTQARPSQNAPTPSPDIEVVDAQELEDHAKLYSGRGRIRVRGVVTSLSLNNMRNGKRAPKLRLNAYPGGLGCDLASVEQGRGIACGQEITVEGEVSTFLITSLNDCRIVERGPLAEVKPPKILLDKELADQLASMEGLKKRVEDAPMSLSTSLFNDSDFEIEINANYIKPAAEGGVEQELRDAIGNCPLIVKADSWDPLNTETIAELARITSLRAMWLAESSESTDYTALSKLPALTSLDIGDVTDSHLRQIAKIKSLTRLVLRLNPEVHDLSPLENLPALRALTVQGKVNRQRNSAELTGPDLAFLGKLKSLSELKITSRRLDLAAHQQIARAKALHTLNLYRTSTNLEGLKAMQDLGRMLRSFHLRSDLVDSSIADVLRHFGQLRELRLDNNDIGDEFVASLDGHKHIQRLYLIETPITDQGLSRLAAQNWPRLVTLNLMRTQVGDRGLAAISESSSLPKLSFLSVGGTNVTDRGIEAAEKKSKFRIQ